MSRTDRLVGLGLALSLLLCLLPGCRKKKPPIAFDGELPPGQVALRKIKPEEYPDFARSGWNLNLLPQAIDSSINWIEAPSSKGSFPYLDITHERAAATLYDFRNLIRAAQNRPDAGTFIDQEIRKRYDVYKSVGGMAPDGTFSHRVLFTGYCTPIYEASLTRQGPFQWPLFKRPAGLVTDPATGETSQPWRSRQEIESGAMAGQEFVWLKSRWEAYVITIQGSAVLRLPDGQMMEIGYAGHNGHEYTSPGLAMIQDGVIQKGQLRAASLGKVFESNPALMDKYLWLNRRTVFFTNRPGGPFGALNQPVTTSATIATDKTVDKVVNMTIYPRSMPAFLNVPLQKSDRPEDAWQFQGFMMDQDTGGAIRAAGRCDIYMGIGPEAERKAGSQLHEGELYYVAIKPEYARGVDRTR